MKSKKVATVLTASERRQRLKLKRIVVSERNYFALKELGRAGDSFNDVISKLLRIQRNYQEKQQQQEQQKSDDENNSASSSGPPFPGSFSELFGEHDRQQLAELLMLRKRRSKNNQTNEQESK